MFITTELDRQILTHLRKSFNEDEILKCTMGQGYFIEPKSEEEARTISHLFDRFVEEIIMYFAVKTETGMQIRIRTLFQLEASLLHIQIPIWDFNEAWDRPLFFIPISTMLLTASELNVIFDETTTRCLLVTGEPRATALRLLGSIF